MVLIGIFPKDSFIWKVHQALYASFATPPLSDLLYLEVRFNLITEFKFGGGSIFVPSFSICGLSLFNDNIEY